MKPLSNEERIGEITALRSKMRANPALHVELLGTLVKTLREHGVNVDGRVISELTIALPEEVTKEMADVVLPGGTNCSN